MLMVQSVSTSKNDGVDRDLYPKAEQNEDMWTYYQRIAKIQKKAKV